MPKKSRSRAKKQIMMGNKVAAHAALNAGATSFFGYPITPSSEILETWVKLVGNPKNPNKSPLNGQKLDYLQCEDEMTSGFAMIGSCMAGKKAFTATAGPGNILMQDAFAAAEALRIPTVAIIMQRGGLSTSTVIYSQQEVTLTAFGGNGEGFRIVYSSSSVQELYDHIIKAFNSAWKYRYPTFVLGDGYLGKMEAEVELRKVDKSTYVKPQPILLDPNSKEPKNLRNCYDLEEEIFEIIEQYRKDYETDSPKIWESESYKTTDADIIIVAHGIVSTAAKAAVDCLRDQKIKAGLWRPITIRPLDTPSLMKAVRSAKKLVFVESSLGQMTRLVHDAIMHNRNPKDKLPSESHLYKPALGIAPQEIIDFVKKQK